MTTLCVSAIFFRQVSVRHLEQSHSFSYHSIRFSRPLYLPKSSTSSSWPHLKIALYFPIGYTFAIFIGFWFILKLVSAPLKGRALLSFTKFWQDLCRWLVLFLSNRIPNRKGHHDSLHKQPSCLLLKIDGQFPISCMLQLTQFPVAGHPALWSPLSLSRFWQSFRTCFQKRHSCLR